MSTDELERLFALLRIPSVSARPEHAEDMRAAADAIAAEVAAAGGTAEVRHGEGHPLVLGEVPASGGNERAPRVLVYGHYDVQPAGDLAEWTSPPFQPTVRDGYLYARGASDDKGNLFMLIAAVQRLAREGRLPVRVTFLVDGEEESGGTSAIDWLAASCDDSAAALIYDGPMIGPERPAFYVGVRGILYRRVGVRTAERDGHSGLLGGAALNAAHALIEVLQAVAPREGRLPEPLYAGVAETTADERVAWDELPPGQEVLRGAGMRPADARAARELYRRSLAAPSLDVHGLSCGEPEAVKTIVPACASATLSLRLAPGQDPAVLGPVLDDLLRDAAPEGADVTIEGLGDASPALVDPDSKPLRAAAEAMERATGWRPRMVRIGGSLPVVAALTARGIPTVLTGFGLPDDRIHAADERLRLEHLELGTRAAMAILSALGE